MGYIYQADTYCDDCGERIRAGIRKAGKAPEDEMDERAYDSDDFPKVYDHRHEESDCPEHCAACGEFLRNPLTSEGYRYVGEQLNEFRTSVTSIARFLNSNHAVLGEWASWYDFTYWDAEDVAESAGKHDQVGWYSGEAF